MWPRYCHKDWFVDCGQFARPGTELIGSDVVDRLVASRAVWFATTLRIA
jgi:hypothetical protein